MRREVMMRWWRCRKEDYLTGQNNNDTQDDTGGWKKEV